MQFLSKSDFDVARNNAAPHIHRTPVLRSATLSAETGADLYLKAEMFQKAGSYKVRGPLNVLAHMSEEARQRGLICSAAGNHAQGVARAARVCLSLAMRLTGPRARAACLWCERVGAMAISPSAHSHYFLLANFGCLFNCCYAAS